MRFFFSFLILTLFSSLSNSKVVENAQSTSRYRLSKESFDRSWSIRLHTSQFSYFEPDVMSESGLLYGFEVQWTKELLSRSDLALQIGLEYQSGRIQYEGSLVSVEDPNAQPIPHQTHGDDLITDLRATVGRGFSVGNGPYRVKPYGGLAYRFLKDLPYGTGAYLREISYIYLPMGVVLETKLRREWQWGATLEYDLFLGGMAKSYMFGTVENHQSSGSGFQLSFDLRRKLSFGQLLISPYYRFWKVEDSEKDVGSDPEVGEVVFTEPKNHSQMTGVLVGFEL